MTDMRTRIFEDAPEPDVVNPLILSPEAQRVIEALSGEDDKVVSFRAIADGSAKDEVAAAEDCEVEDEDETTSSPADWSTVSTKRARQFVRDCPDARIEILFPAVFEEDRSTKIADLDAAFTAKAIPHRTMAEQMAKELGIENYDYDTAMAQIEDEQGSLAPRSLGSGDALADRAQGDARRGPADSLDRNSLRDDRPPADELLNSAGTSADGKSSSSRTSSATTEATSSASSNTQNRDRR